MSAGRITRDTERRHRLTGYKQAESLEPEPLHAGWATFVSHRSVRAIAPAPHSRMLWLATWGGVLAWNYKDRLCRRYSSEHGLASNVVTCLCIDAARRPWAGHAEGGLSYFKTPHWQVYDYLQKEPIRAVTSAGDRGGIWVAGEARVYYISDLDREPELVSLEHDGAIKAQALLADGDTLLLGNAWGLFRLRPGSKPARIAQDTLDACTALARDGDGNVWAATPGAVYRLEGDTPSRPFAPGPSDPAGRIIGLSAGRRWAWALTTAGPVQVKAGRWQPVLWQDPTQSPPITQTIAVSTDDARLWIGTDNLMASVYARGQEPEWTLDMIPRHAEDDLSNLARCITPAIDGQRVWVGTAGGLVEFGPDDEWAIYSQNGDVRGLAPSQAGGEIPWQLTWPGGVCGNPACSISQPPDLPLTLAVGQDGQPYVATGQGLWQLDGSEAHKRSEAPPRTPRCLAQTPDEQWWMGTVGGVFRLNGGYWELAGESPGPVQAGVHALAAIGDTLWAATEAGLWSRQVAGWHAHLQDSQFVRALAPASEAPKLWVAREDGIVRYDPATGTMDKVYTPANSGLGSRRVTAMVERANILWIATSAGISRVKLDEEKAANE